MYQRCLLTRSDQDRSKSDLRPYTPWFAGIVTACAFFEIIDFSTVEIFWWEIMRFLCLNYWSFFILIAKVVCCETPWFSLGHPGNRHFDHVWYEFIKMISLKKLIKSCSGTSKTRKDSVKVAETKLIEESKPLARGKKDIYKNFFCRLEISDIFYPVDWD